MNVFVKLTSYKVLLAVIIFSSITACAQIRKLTYPEDFNYQDKAQVEKLMRSMGKSIERVNQLVSDVSRSSNNKQQQVVSELIELQSIASSLSGGHEQTNQLFISDHIEQFISDISTAMMFAKTNPPDYSKAGEITNSCQECHQSR